MEPDQGGEERAARGQAPGRQTDRIPEEAESEQGEQGGEDFGIDAEGIEQHRRGETDQEPEGQGQLLPIEFLPGQEVDLQPEKGSDQAHAQTGQRFEGLGPEKLAQGHERKEVERNARRMERIDLARFDSERAVGFENDLGRKVGVVIAPVVIIGQIEVAVGKQALSHQKVMRFIAARGPAVGHHDDGRGVIDQDGEKEQDRQLAARGELQKASCPGRPDQGRCPADLHPADDFQVDDRQENHRQPETQPGGQVLAAQIMLQGQRGQSQEKQRRPSPEILIQRALIRQPGGAAEDVRRQGPKPGQQHVEESRGEKEMAGVDRQPMGLEGITPRLAAHLKVKGGQQGHHRERGLAERCGDLRHGAILDEADGKVKMGRGNRRREFIAGRAFGL